MSRVRLRIQVRLFNFMQQAPRSNMSVRARTASGQGIGKLQLPIVLYK